MIKYRLLFIFGLVVLLALVLNGVWKRFGKASLDELQGGSQASEEVSGSPSDGFAEFVREGK